MYLSTIIILFIQIFSIWQQILENGEFNRKQKFKVFIKNLYFLTKKLINEEIIPLKEASWVINEKSHNYFHWYCDVFQRIEYLIILIIQRKK